MSPSIFIRHAITAVVIAASSVVGVPAQAAPVDPGQPPALGMPKPGTTAECAEQVGFHGQIGYKICGTGHWWHNWFNTAEHFFVIGLDHAVWHNHMDSRGNLSGWHSLGGWLQAGVTWQYYNELDPYDLGILSFGADGRPWCNNLGHLGWSDWYRCD